ncbi:MAG TPA: prenyltransferase/squalene oxidase repeat-containing protein, partial [Conexibacter sp.]|nr:prenyltransferase/squalene oxidase repeat-containing protein [Conexibacter sp.]
MSGRTIVVAACLALLALCAPAAGAATQQQVATATSAASQWIASQQDPATGEIPNFGGDWSLSALAAAGVNAADLGGPSAQDFYLGLWNGADWTPVPDPTTGMNVSFYVDTDFERAIMLAHAAGLQPSRLSADQNLVAQLAALYDAPDGAFTAPSLNGNTFGLFALAPEHAPHALLAKLAAYVRANRHDDGGWTYTPVTSPADAAAPSDVDMTGAAIGALCTAGATPDDPYVAGGIAFLRGKLISATGAFDAMFGANTDSNAWAIDGLTACGVDPQSPAWTTADGRTPVDYLLSLQRASGPGAGSFKYDPTEDDAAQPSLYVTQDALRALAAGGFVVDPPARADVADPRVRPAPTVADGTSVPLALAIDDGAGDVRLCRVTALTGSTVADVLSAAQANAVPAGCVTAVGTTGGAVTSVDGAAGDWLASVDGGPESPAGTQTVGLGDLVSLRLPAAGSAQLDASALA